MTTCDDPCRDNDGCACRATQAATWDEVESILHSLMERYDDVFRRLSDGAVPAAEHAAPVLGGPDEDAILHRRLADLDTAPRADGPAFLAGMLAADLARARQSRARLVRLVRDAREQERLARGDFWNLQDRWNTYAAQVDAERDAARRQVEALEARVAMLEAALTEAAVVADAYDHAVCGWYSPDMMSGRVLAACEAVRAALAAPTWPIRLCRVSIPTGPAATVRGRHDIAQG